MTSESEPRVSLQNKYPFDLQVLNTVAVVMRSRTERSANEVDSTILQEQSRLVSTTISQRLHEGDTIVAINEAGSEVFGIQETEGVYKVLKMRYGMRVGYKRPELFLVDHPDLTVNATANGSSYLHLCGMTNTGERERFSETIQAFDLVAAKVVEKEVVFPQSSGIVHVIENSRLWPL